MNKVFRVPPVAKRSGELGCAYLYLRQHKHEDYRIIPVTSVDAGVALAYTGSANPDFYIEVDGVRQVARKQVKDRAHVMGMTGVRAEGLPRLVQSRDGSAGKVYHEDPHMLIRGRNGAMKRVRKPVPPMSPYKRLASQIQPDVRRVAHKPAVGILQPESPAPSDVLLAAEAARKLRSVQTASTARSERESLARREQALAQTYPVYRPDLNSRERSAASVIGLLVRAPRFHAGSLIF